MLSVRDGLSGSRGELGLLGSLGAAMGTWQHLAKGLDNVFHCFAGNTRPYKRAKSKP